MTRMIWMVLLIATSRVLGIGLAVAEGNEKEENKPESDLHRPRYHIVYTGGDVNGGIYFNNKYHLGYLGRGGWAHISSKDLVHWQQHPAAFQNEKPIEVALSGCTVLNNEGVPTAVFWDWPGSPPVAGGIKWKIHPKNPVLPTPQKGQPEYELYAPHDCYVWREGEEFYMIMGNAQFPGSHLEGPVPFLLKSKDLLDWKYIGRFMDMQKPMDMGWVLPWEDAACPEFFKLGDKYVLKFISHFYGEQYFIGDYKGERFYPESHRRMNWIGGGYFASESILGPNGRRIIFAWVQEQRAISERAKDWLNVCSLPAEMYLSDEGKVLVRPVKELRSLRTNQRTHQHRHLPSGKPFKPGDIKGCSIEIEVVIAPMNSDKVGIKVLCSPDMQEYTVIEYDQRKRTLSIDSSRSSASEKSMRVFPNPYTSGHQDETKIFETTHHRDIPVHSAPLHLEEDDLLRLDIFIDKSIIEVFANNRQLITSRVYPTRADSKEIYFFSEGGDGWAHVINAWDMKEAGVVK